MAKIGGENIQLGLNFAGTVNQIISPTEFICAGLAGLGDPFFQGWDVWVVRKGTGTGAAPQDDKNECVAYVSINGRFTVKSLWDTAPLAVGDQIYLIQPFVSENTYIVDQPSNEQKQSSDAEVTTIPAAIVKSLPFAGKVGGARIKFDLRVSGLPGTASAIIYKNGAPVVVNPAATPVFTVYTDTTGVYQTFSQDISGLVVGDLIQLYAVSSGPLFMAYVRNFRISYDIVALPSVQAISDKVYFDSINGVAGTEWPIGESGNPVNNWADAQTIAKARNRVTIQLVHGVITLNANTSGYYFIGNRFSDPTPLYQENAIELNGFILSNSSFESINIDNNSMGVPNLGSLVSCGYFNNCPRVSAYSMTYCYAFLNCGGIKGAIINYCSGFVNTAVLLAGTLSNSYGFSYVPGIQATTMSNCWAFIHCGLAVGTVTNCYGFDACSTLTPETISFVGYAGLFPIFNFIGQTLIITNLTNPAAVLEFSGDFSLIIAASCNNGVINVRGNIKLTNNSVAPCVVNDYTILGAITALGEGSYWQTFGPGNVQIAQAVSFGVTVFEPGGGIIPVADITPGTYTVDRIRAGAVVHVIPATASSKTDGSVFMGYNFPVVDGWAIGDLGIVTFSGIIITIGGVATHLPPVQIYTRLVMEPDIDSVVNNINTEVETTSLALGTGSVATHSRLGLLVRWIADALNNATNGLVAIFNAILGKPNCQDIVIYPVAFIAGTAVISDDGSSPAYYPAVAASTTSNDPAAPGVAWSQLIDFEQGGIITIICIYIDTEWQSQITIAPGDATHSSSKLQISRDGGANWVDITDIFVNANPAMTNNVREGDGGWITTVIAGVSQLGFRLVHWTNDSVGGVGRSSSQAQIRSNSAWRITYRKS